MSSLQSLADIESLDDFYEVLPNRHYEPLWTMKGVLTPEPFTQMVPYLWAYEEAHELIMRAGALVSVEEADRRVLAMKNPGTGPHEMARTTDTLWAALQMVLPGEIAPPHRHTAAALRFIIEGDGAYTVVDGQRCDMDAGDFLLTPNWSWHEHGHTGSDPMVWLDCLDVPMVHTLHLIFAEFGQGRAGDRPMASAALRSGALRPAWKGASEAPTLLWKFDEVMAAFDHLRDAEGSPHDDLLIEYRDPSTNGPVLPTMSAYMQLLRPGCRTKAHRHTASSVHHVVRGSGVSVLGGAEFEWKKGDTFAIPVWTTHSHSNPTSDDALLFSFSDAPAISALGLLREQPAE